MLYTLGLEKGIFSQRDTYMSGVAILQTSNRWEIVDSIIGEQGRVIGMNIKNGENLYSLVNVYGPSGDNNSNAKRIFYRRLERWVKENLKNAIIMGGDFNTTLEEIDLQGVKSNTRRAGREELQHLVRTCRLTDTYRHLYPGSTATTYVHHNKKTSSRIDRIYTHETIAIQTAQHIDSTLKYTDHRALHVNLGTQAITPNRNTYYKFNDALLEHAPFTQYVTELLQLNYETFKNHTHRIQFYENIKHIIKQQAQQAGRRLRKERKREVDQLEAIVERVKADKNRDFFGSEDYRYYEDKLKELQEGDNRGAQVRSRLSPIIEEKPTREFLRMEKIIQGKREIRSIEIAKGVVTTDPAEIVGAFHRFYTDLYRREKVDIDTQNHFLEYSATLSEAERQELEVEFSTKEIENSINKLNADSSPGPDGLTSLFYKFFAKDLIPYLSLVYKDIYTDMQLPTSHTISYITLLPKEDSGSLQETNNYRPISLLNSEYKLLTSMLASRVGPYLGKLVHTDQACTIQGRSILHHCHFIRDLISDTHKAHTPACILSIDQAKAFDRVDHSWLHRVVAKCNLGRFYTKWIQILYSNAISQVIVNHSLSEPLQVTRGVRQGDPLSPLLYVLTIEPLLNCIRADKTIPPISLPGNQSRKLIGYADDTNFFIKEHSSIDKIIKHFKKFSKASGSLINEDKTKALPLGRWRPDPFRKKINYVEKLKIFGLFFTNDIRTCGEQNWTTALNFARDTIEMLKFRNASIFGRAVLVNTLIQSKFVYPLQIFDPPNDVFNQYRAIVRPYILQGCMRRIKDATLTLSRENGGVGLHDLELKHVSCRLKYLRDFLDNANEVRMAFAKLHLGVTARHERGLHFDNRAPHSENIPSFYKNCIQLFKTHKNYLENIDKKDYYAKLNEPERKRMEELEKELPRYYPHYEQKHIFKRLHNTNKTTPKQKQITYRLLYGITPCTAYNARTNRTQYLCTTCRYAQEREQHIFWGCRTKLRESLIKALRLPINTKHKPIHTQQNHYNITFDAVFLNQFPFRNPVQSDIRNVILGIYRETLWHTRNRTLHNNIHTGDEQLELTFRRRIDHAFKTKFKASDIEHYNTFDQTTQYDSECERGESNMKLFEAIREEERERMNASESDRSSLLTYSSTSEKENGSVSTSESDSSTSNPTSFSTLPSCSTPSPVVSACSLSTADTSSAQNYISSTDSDSDQENTDTYSSSS